jgi:acetyl-CoA acyltransferase
MSNATHQRVAVIGGARIVLTLANELKRRDARFGLVSICGAGATAVAMLLERS